MLRLPARLPLHEQPPRSRLIPPSCCPQLLPRFTQGLLAAVAGLAHRLDAAGLLARIESYLQSEGRLLSCAHPALQLCHLFAASTAFMPPLRLSFPLCRRICERRGGGTDRHNPAGGGELHATPLPNHLRMLRAFRTRCIKRPSPAPPPLQACHLGGLADTCLSLLARKLAASGPYWHEQARASLCWLQPHRLSCSSYNH